MLQKNDQDKEVRHNVENAIYDIIKKIDAFYAPKIGEAIIWESK